MNNPNQKKPQDKFEENQSGGGKGSTSQPEQKINWVQWAIIGLIAIIIALAILL